MSEAKAESNVADLVLRNLVDKAGKSVPASHLTNPGLLSVTADGSDERRTLSEWMTKIGESAQSQKEETLFSYLTQEQIAAVQSGEVSENLASSIQKAVDDCAGSRMLYIPAGKYATSEIRVPSNSYIEGAGIGLTELILHESADVNDNVFTNVNNIGSNQDQYDRNIVIKNLTANGNSERLAAGSGLSNFEPGLIEPHQSKKHPVNVDGVTSGYIRVDAYFSVDHPDLSLRALATEDGVVTVEFINTSDVPLNIPSGEVRANWFDYSFSGYTVGCSFGFAGVENLLLDHVHGKNAAKHSCSIDSSVFDLGAGDDVDTYASYPSKNVWVERSMFSHGGDDCFTSHGVEGLWVINCYAFDGFPTYVENNNNGFEIDDCSRNVVIENPRSVNCTSGLEIKAHSTSAAARNVHVTNPYFAFMRSSGVDIHHTSHGDEGQPSSPTGAEVTIIGGKTLYCDEQYMRILSYRNVYVAGHTFIDDGRSESSKPIAIENGANHVTFEHVRAEGFKSANNILFIQSGKTYSVNIRDSEFFGGTEQGCYIGTGVAYLTLSNVRFSALNDNTTAIVSGSNLDSYGVILDNVYYRGHSKFCVAAGVDIPYFQNVRQNGSALGGNVALGSRCFKPTELQSSNEGWFYKDGEAFSGARNGGTVLALNRYGNTGQIVSLQYNGNSVGSIYVNGSSTEYNTTSDASLKNDIGELSIETALKIVDMINIHEYTYKNNGEYDIGVFAQELYEVYPRAVTPGGWINRHTESEAEEGDSDAIYRPWGVDYSKLMPVIVKALQHTVRAQKDIDHRLIALESKD